MDAGSHDLESNKPDAPGPKAKRGWFSDSWWCALPLIALVVLTYLPVWSAGFIWDDDSHFAANPVIIGPLGLKEIWTTAAARICPLVLTNFWVQYHLWGLSPAPYHAVNVLLHAANALLLWRVLRLMRIPGAWLGAALWALHPVAVESVAWVTELKNVQAAFFYLASIYFWLKWLGRVTEPRLAPSRFVRELPYALAVLCAALAMASKSATVILPGILLLTAWWQTRNWSWLARLAPMGVFAILMSLLSLWTQKLEGADDVRWALSWPERCLVAGHALWFYLGKLAWPRPLIFIYPRWEISATNGFCWAWPISVITASAILAVAFRQGRVGARSAIMVAGCYAVALLPILGFGEHLFLRYSFVADHFQYLASMAPLALLGAWVALAGRRVPLITYSLGALLLAGAALLSRQHALVFKDNATLWADTLAHNSDAWVAHKNLGLALAEAGHLDEAISQFEATLAINPTSSYTRKSLADAYLKQRKLDAALEQYRMVLRLNPSNAQAANDEGFVLVEQGKADQAMRAFREALKIDPKLAAAHYSLGNALVQRGQFADALVEYQQAVDLQPRDTDAHINLGVCLRHLGRVDEAIQEYRKALEILPTKAKANYNLGNALYQQGHIREAMEAFNQELAHHPDDIDACQNLAWLLATTGELSLRDGPKAESLAQHASTLAHDANPIILRTLAAAQAEAKHLQEAIATAERAATLANRQGIPALSEALTRDAESYRRRATTE